jgi:hypothetical protein
MLILRNSIEWIKLMNDIKELKSEISTLKIDKKILEISLDIYMKKLDDLCDEVKYLKSIQDVE